MNISNQIIQCAAILTGPNLWFYEKKGLELKQPDSNESYTLDGIKLTPLAGDDYLLEDTNGITYGLLKGDSKLDSENEFPAEKATHIRIASDHHDEADVDVAPCFSTAQPEEKSAEFLEFSVADQDTVFHRRLLRTKKEKFLEDDDSGDEFSLKEVTFFDVGAHDVTPAELGLSLSVAKKVENQKEDSIDKMIAAIGSASDKLKEILKFRIGTDAYQRYESEIGNVFNGVQSWLMERAMNDLDNHELMFNYHSDMIGHDKDKWVSGLSTAASVLNVIASVFAPPLSREDINKMLSERTLEA